MIHFTINYNTAWGESLVLKTGRKAHQMRYTHDGFWAADLKNTEIRNGQGYSYELLRDGRCLRREWRTHTFNAPEKAKEITVRDRWIDRPANSAFWASAFKDVVFHRDSTPRAKLAGNVVLRTVAPEIRPDQVLAISGSSDALGRWKVARALCDSDFPWWETSLKADTPFEYKYVVADRASGKIILWEEGPNHVCDFIPGKDAALIIEDVVPGLKPLPWRGAGVAIPVFSLRSKDSFGVGEFHDIKKMVDWAVATGQNFIQLLPVNDTSMTGTWRDSYPYNSVSSFALHPQFIYLPEAGVTAGKTYSAKQQALNALDKIDYEKVNGEKMKLLHKLFDSRQEKFTKEDKYLNFVAENRFWLLPYAVFCCLRDELGTVDWRTWGKYSKYSKKKIEDYAAANAGKVAFWCWIQFILDRQLKDAVAYAHAHRVAIKGDLPIGVSPVSADAWTNPDLFNLDMQAGAPPDAFSADGQNWGFPTYNWERMAEDDFAWWRARLQKMSEYFDAYRIDHILGFFRIWEIPARYKSGLMGHFAPALPYSEDELRNMGFDFSCGKFVTPVADDETDVLFVEDPRKKGFWHPRISAQFTKTYAQLDGALKDRFNALYNDFFYHRHDDFWRESAMRKLPSLLRSSAMLSCGEDLGMIPGCVASVMEELNILSLEIQRMPKDTSVEFADPARYPYYCVCATGTHDTSPLRAWWEEDRNLTQRFYNEMMHCGGGAPWFCEPWVAEAILREHLYSPAMLAILPLQDYLAVDGRVRYSGDPADERINIPANPRHYWRYRMHLTLEEMIADSELCNRIRDMISDAARGN
ncbi:MAG: 4-alpha-glucanotransferase [Bacteroidales bacterium]|nr:4-alpha-glucanotransferase [Bacteroidales bacterium]